MTELTETNLKVIMRVHERLQKFPDTHNQGIWYELDRREMCECEEGECECRPLDEGDLLKAAHGGRWCEGLVVDAAQMRECGTTACLAGHAVCAAIELGVEVDRSYSMESVGAKLLGLHAMQADRAFYHSPAETVRSRVAEAAETGEWPEW